MAAHATPCRAVGVSFIPLAVKSLGGAGCQVHPLYWSLLGQRLGTSPSITSRQLFQRCSVSLWRGNAALWLHRFPPISSYIDSIVWLCLCGLFCFLYFVVFFCFFVVFCFVLLFTVAENNNYMSNSISGRDFQFSQTMRTTETSKTLANTQIEYLRHVYSI